MSFSALRAPHVSTIALAAAAASGIAAAATFLLLRHRAVSKNNLVPVGRVANIFIYPIKAIAGIEVPYADCIVTGPVYEGLRDRCSHCCLMGAACKKAFTRTFCVYVDCERRQLYFNA